MCSFVQLLPCLRGSKVPRVKLSQTWRGKPHLRKHSYFAAAEIVRLKRRP
jgi:hypothetical protein